MAPATFIAGQKVHVPAMYGERLFIVDNVEHHFFSVGEHRYKLIDQSDGPDHGKTVMVREHEIEADHSGDAASIEEANKKIAALVADRDGLAAENKQHEDEIADLKKRLGDAVDAQNAAEAKKGPERYLEQDADGNVSINGVLIPYHSVEMLSKATPEDGRFSVSVEKGTSVLTYYSNTEEEEQAYLSGKQKTVVDAVLAEIREHHLSIETEATELTARLTMAVANGLGVVTKAE